MSARDQFFSRYMYVYNCIHVSIFGSDKISIRFYLTNIIKEANEESVNEEFFFHRTIRNKKTKKNIVIHWFAADESGGVYWAFEPMGIRWLAKNTFWITVGGDETKPPSRKARNTLTSTYLYPSKTSNSAKGTIQSTPRI